MTTYFNKYAFKNADLFDFMKTISDVLKENKVDIDFEEF